MVQAPAVAKESAFFCPSVMYSGMLGFLSFFMQEDGQSTRTSVSLGISYLSTLTGRNASESRLPRFS